MSDETMKVLILTLGSIATGIIGIIGPVVLYVIAKLREKQNLDSIKIDANAQKLNQKLDENTDITQEVKDTQAENSKKLDAIHEVGNSALEVQLVNSVNQTEHIVDLLTELKSSPEKIANATAIADAAKKLLTEHKANVKI